VEDLLESKPISMRHRGLLPFRVWQIFDEMVEFAKNEKAGEFVCAAGVLTHYLGDACQPLHISYLHDGDPEQATSRTVHHRDGTTDEKRDPLGVGVHSAYEDAMVNANRVAILQGLEATDPPDPHDHVSNGYEAALRTIDLMRRTFELLPPTEI